MQAAKGLNGKTQIKQVEQLNTTPYTLNQETLDILLNQQNSNLVESFTLAGMIITPYIGHYTAYIKKKEMVLC